MLATDTTTFLLEPHLPFFNMVVSSRLERIHSVEIEKIYWHIFFVKKFRESIVYIKKITKELISQNISLMRVNFSIFHTVWTDGRTYNN